MTDEELAQRACAGDQPALEELFVRHQAHLRALVARSLADPDDVVDVVQDAFVDVLRGLHSYDPGRPFLPWMRVVCRNRLFRFLRERRGRAALAIEEVLEPVAVEDLPAFGAEELGRLRECLGALEATARRLLDGRYRDGLPVDELARRCGCSANALMVRLHRLRAALRDCLRRKGVPA